MAKQVRVALALACAACAGGRDGDHGDVPTAPIPLAPRNASCTGGPHTPAIETARPVFAWTWVEHGDQPVTYDLELDDGCEPGRLQRCAFDTPAVRETGLSTPRYRPALPLDIATQPPVGRRYYWRVRACAGDACSPWSRVRYVEVGRAIGDFNGDGFSDVVVGAPLIDNDGVDQGSAFVYYGARGGLREDVRRLDDPERGDGSVFGVSVAVAGDVDADGFADLVVGAPGTRDHVGLTYVFHGTAAGIERYPRMELRDPKGQVGDWFGASVAGAGDVDGDGHADVLVGASGADRDGVDWGVTFLYYGGPDGARNGAAMRIASPTPQDYDHFGYALAPAGDVNGDGYADLLIGSPGMDMAGMQIGVDRGAVYVFHGGADGPSRVPGARLEAPVPLDYDRFGFAARTAGDVDGDGFDDVIVGAPGVDAPLVDGGVAYVFAGAAAGVVATPQTVLEDPRIEIFDRFGTSVADAGDVDADGFADVIVGTSGRDRGRGLVFHGGREGIDPMPGAVLLDPLGPGYNHFADHVSGAGDINGDGFDDIAIGASGTDNGGVFRGSAVLYPGSAIGVDDALPLRLNDPDRGEHDHFGHVVAGR